MAMAPSAGCPGIGAGRGARRGPRRITAAAGPGAAGGRGRTASTITEFGAVGDGKTVNTVPFQNAVFYVRSFADKGGAQLYVPKGRWLTGSFNLTSHLTLYLEKDAVIIGSKDSSQWRDRGTFAILWRGTVSVSQDAISLKSGWDKYGISFGRPTSDIRINRVDLRSSSGAALAFGSEMSGGISNVHVNHIRIHDSYKGISLKTARGRGGYIKEVAISDVKMENVHIGIEFTGNCSSHPDESFDPSDLPVVNQITMKKLVGTNISFAGALSGIDGSPFTAICLSNLNFSMAADSASDSWSCANISGYSETVSP
ncbi:hypothetical protein HU200_049120 [Digitaria exilis]|uniref:Polygalacturonase n=1 Tax=Digitaria exilis TaxID=1010633 RepID=A0A835EA96_9POAL|nr:hypothetical protein HU200_049120 [Digitaria exilis]